jgi:hypothetical protein
MKLLGLALALTFALATSMVVFAINVEHRDPDRLNFDVHPPKSDDEKAAARVGLAYARAVQAGNPAAACRLASTPKCGTIRCGGDRVFHAKQQGEIVDVVLDTCHLTLGRRGARWVVIDQVPLAGYA